MSRALEAAPISSRPALRRVPVERSADLLLDGVVVVLATWTVVYHLCLVLRLGVQTALLAELVLLAGAAFLFRSRVRRSVGQRAEEDLGAPRQGGRVQPLVMVTVGCAVLSALGMAISAPWVLVWPPFLLAALGGSWHAIGVVRRAGVRTPRVRAPSADAPWGGRTGVVVLAWALALTVLSTFVVRSNPDDLFYLNVAQWVASRGEFPLRDTLFSDLAYPMSNWPPTASYDAMVGALAYLGGVKAATVAYVLVTPVATFLSVLALWRLLRSWQVVHVGVALSAALVFLLFDGTSSYASPGNLFLTRLWQGKVILLCVVVPLLLVYALAHVQNPSRRSASRLFLGGTAAVALSTTALFLTPIIAAAGAAPLLLQRRWRAAMVGFGAMAAYPLGAATATVVLGGRSADDFASRRLFRFDPSWFGPEIFLTGFVAAAGVLAVLLGALLVPHPAARVTTGLLVLATAVTFVPGVTDLGYDLVGLGPTLWRVSWVCTVGALVGVLVAWTGAHLRGLRQRWAAPAAAVVAGSLLAAFGAPIWASETSSTFGAPWQWKRGDSTRPVTEWLIETGSAGERVLAPDPVSITVAVTTTKVKTVAPRDYYMDYLREDPSFHFSERLALTDFVNHDGPWEPREVRQALGVLDVDSVCLYAEDRGRAAALRPAGFVDDLVTKYYRCLRR